MDKIKMFEDFVPVGFGNSMGVTYSLGGSRNIGTGYNMDAIAGPVTEACNKVASEGMAYESNDNPDHKLESYVKEAKELINNKIDEACENYKAMNEGAMSEIHLIANEVKSEAEFIKRFFAEFGDKIKKSKDTTEWAKSLYTDMKNESVITEADDYEFNPSEAAERLKRREEQNIQRYRAAQDREDNYGIALYELKIKLDKIDLERLKIQTAIHALKEKNGK